MSPNKVEAHETHDGEKPTGASNSRSSMVDRWQVKAKELKSKAHVTDTEKPTDDTNGGPIRKQPAATPKPSVTMKRPAKKLKAIYDHFDDLKFKPHCTEPRHYGSVTIYTDTKRSLWRVKPFPGARQENRVAMKSTIADKRIQ